MNTRRYKRLPESGFSLLELVVVVAMMTIVMGAAFALMTDSQVNFDRNQLLAEAHQNADFAVARVTELVRGAGANPANATTINKLTFLTNKDVGSSTVDYTLLRILSDLNSDSLTNARVANSGSNYYILSSEDVTVKFYQNATTVNGAAIPANSLCLTDNTPDGGQQPAQYVPVVLASNVTAFNCQVGSDPRVVVMTVTAGPSKPMPTTDPRYITFTRTSEIRLRNRN